MPGPTTYRYDAFISYRHLELDRTWAKWLHKALETFRTPKALVAAGAPARIKRVFRDEEELPASSDLSGVINEALEQSRYLIVVCSSRTPESASDSVRRRSGSITSAPTLRRISQNRRCSTRAALPYRMSSKRRCSIIWGTIQSISDPGR